ncbi:F0F1 ATP synthase subunit A [Azospirillum baldaniorum]|uniref:ATP synthase subunit a n=2 Tax=Azospirillum TaxID=191 RepID=A0A9P1JPS7_9PROT|nr:MULTISPECIES: F0F1 ATP synthase subunit A [Azospirillum]AWJ90427.1 F0F1 ATP synthase subunit A [Azospirillum baldaniorum]NUB04772.1 F0F1 ATP synthase subunit A [Azospirillum baldaniorum]QCO15748.1 F0F1 ATP synthase subunit A [Azospirillum brasilense]TWA60497.1 ATP synthase F0 subcomplex A subunit [Azospirillum baldaniorum]TWA75302.1 ATP synthase F0 subcomplex A subunit [Azospirillum brasilense]
MDPLHQFQINPILQIVIAGYDVSFTNSAFFMVVAVALIYALLVFGMSGRALVPGRLQSLAEIFYEFVANMVRDNAGHDARPYFPFVFAIFMFVLFGNLVGMIPFTFTFTSHIIVTFTLAATVFVFVTVLALMKHGLHFFSFFMPHGAPVLLAPILIPIEVISYLMRPVSLSIRLFANMMAGHTMLKVFAGFTVMMISGLGAVGFLAGLVPLAINIALTGFEFLVAFLQAYVFSILTCLYIRDALELH